MTAALRQITPDVAVRVVPCLMDRWNKAAAPVYVDNKLVLWQPAA